MSVKYPTVGIGIPMFNEEESIEKLINSVYESIRENSNYSFHVFVVDDGSIDRTENKAKKIEFKKNNISFSVLRLKYNVGHQRAIHQAAIFAKEKDFDYLIIMDGDGEDNPNAIPKLLDKCNNDIVLVRRGKRKENFAFRFFYRLYKWLFWILTGSKISFGNFSLVNKKVIENIVEIGFVHYSAFLSKLRVKRVFITSDRAKRLAGESKMRFSSLVHHGFKSLVEYAEQTLFSLFKLFILVMVLIICVVGVIFYKKFVVEEAIIGWTSNMLLGLMILALNSFGFFITGVFLYNLSSKSSSVSTQPLYSIVHEN